MDGSGPGLLLEQMRECAREAGGPVSARARAAMLGRQYRGMPAADRDQFMHLLAHDLAPDPKFVGLAHAAYARATGTPSRWEAEHALRQALVSPRSRILRQFNELPDGLKFLVDLRADVLTRLAGDPGLAVLDHELQARLASWFDVGFLDLQRITWESPAALLEKLIDYEAVHQIRSWGDLKNRLDSDRRCYAFFHPRMPREPLIFVEVALTRELSPSVQPLLDEAAPLLDPTEATAAIFYSISSTQPGLRGISLGNFLIKRVVEALHRDFPRLEVFSTLSPLPLFRKWIDRQFEGDALPLDDRLLRPLADLLGPVAGRSPLQQALQRTRWTERPDLAEALRAPMASLCAHYLTRVKQGEHPLDPVARFHLANGARIERVNWAADISVNGFNQSYGMMVNYRYLPDEIEHNVDRYSEAGHIALGPELS
jgi:malonyl-CoA decarboxylase